MKSPPQTLSARREFVFLYDIRMGNPAGPRPEENPAVLRDGTVFVPPARLRRFVREYLRQRGWAILAGAPARDGAPVSPRDGSGPGAGSRNAGPGGCPGEVVAAKVSPPASQGAGPREKTASRVFQVQEILKDPKAAKAKGEQLVGLFLDGYIDARLFGGTFCFPGEAGRGGGEEEMRLTGPVQLGTGEILHQSQPVGFQGQRPALGKGVRYGMIGISGVANEHAATLTRMTEADYTVFLEALWNGVRSGANLPGTQGQMPHFLLDLRYRDGEVFQFGRLHEYLRLEAASGKAETDWSSPADFRLDIRKLVDRLNTQRNRIAEVRVARSPDVTLYFESSLGWTCDWKPFDCNTPSSPPARP